MNWSIGPIRIAGRAVLAPLAGVSSAPFRQICLEHGCHLAVTEMVSSEALIREKSVARRMRRAANERCLVIQLFGSRPEVMARAAAIAIERAGADVIDVNMGCPVRKILGTGAGVALMKDPLRAGAIVQKIVEVCGSTVPVTVKMRAGWDDTSINAVEVAKRVTDHGASAIAVHARTKDQFHKGTSRWEIIAEVKQAVLVPVIGNGGVQTRLDANRMMGDTGCDAVMIGRAALGNPWVFEDLAGKCSQGPTLAQRFAVIRKHIALYAEYAGEKATAREMRKHLCWYLKGLSGSAMVRGKLQTMHGVRDMREVLDAYEQAMLDRQGQ